MDKYTSPRVQSECLPLMALHILCEVSRNIAGGASIMALQGAVHHKHLGWVDRQLIVHK